MWLQTMWMPATSTSPFPLGVAVEAVEITKLSARPSSETSERTLAWVSGDKISPNLTTHVLNSHPYGLKLNSISMRNAMSFRACDLFCRGSVFSYMKVWWLFYAWFFNVFICTCVRLFRCAGNAIQAFGYGTDAGLVPITESQSAVPSVRTNLQPAIITKHVINSNDVKQIDSACVFSTCANLQVGLKTLLSITWGYVITQWFQG